ncbi:uncharacterized protein LOC122378028 [Amphibalanus amphitrite]|uniref:uncharacterized protein LOC122378028 n=1 Tax=Amphibalanus amphitrite TaxID=1232801 RepID=UPI001C90CED9|nr:uncharacterized protein LOC122378028 [Amphibalanus amphitrite]
MVSPPASSGRVPAAGASSPSPGPAALQQPWLEGQLLVLPSPLPLHVHCPVAGCPRSYANQVQTAVRHSLLRHLRTDFHPGTSECLWCRKWYTTRRGLLNHRARCPRRPPPAPPQPTDWAAALARLRAETAPAAGAPARPATPTSPELDLSLSPPPPPPGQGRPSPPPEPTPPPPPEPTPTPSPGPTPTPAPEEDRLSPPPSPGPLPERWWSPTQPSPEEPTSPPLVFPAPSSGSSDTSSPPSLLVRLASERRPAADGGEPPPTGTLQRSAERAGQCCEKVTVLNASDSSVPVPPVTVPPALVPPASVPPVTVSPASVPPAPEPSPAAPVPPVMPPSAESTTPAWPSRLRPLSSASPDPRHRPGGNSVGGASITTPRRGRRSPNLTSSWFWLRGPGVGARREPSADSSDSSPDSPSPAPTLYLPPSSSSSDSTSTPKPRPDAPPPTPPAGAPPAEAAAPASRSRAGRGRGRGRGGAASARAQPQAQEPELTELQRLFLPRLEHLLAADAEWAACEEVLTAMVAEASRRNEAYHAKRAEETDRRRRQPPPDRQRLRRDPPRRPDPAGRPAAAPAPPPGPNPVPAPPAEGAAPPPPPPADRRRQYRPPQYDPAEASRLQRLYRTNRARAMREVLAEDGPRCSLDPAAIRSHFSPSPTADPPVDWDARPPCVPELGEASQCDGLTRPFTEDEVWQRLRSAANTAPGPDGLRYVAWRALDPGARLLTLAYNVCKSHRRLPGEWGKSSTVLIHKGGDADDPSCWRPIALISTIAKVYAGLWADRLSRWAEGEDLLSPGQKGFRHYDGVLEHNFILQSALTASRRAAGGELHVCFVDLTNAFGSLSHSYLWDVLARLGLEPEVLLALQSIYDGTTTVYATAQGVSEPAPVVRGVRQGCPLSGVLFALAMEPLVRALNGIDGVEALAFADDVALLCRDHPALESALTALEDVCAWCGLHPNPRKSGLLSIVVGEGGSYRYLGRPVGHSRLSCPPTEVLDDARRAAERVTDSALAPWQKLDALRSCVMPRLTHCLRLGLLPKTALRSLDAAIRWRVKGILNLPSRASAEYLYSGVAQGCVGLTELAVEADMLLVASTWQLLTSPDEAVRTTAEDQLTECVRRRLSAPPTAAQVAGYLNGEAMRDGGDVATRFSRARVATKALAKLVGIRWQAADGQLSLTLDGEPLPRGKAAALLRDAVRRAAAARLHTKPHQGKVMRCVADQRISSHYMYSGDYTRFAEWRFVHRARLGLVPLNGARHGAAPGDQRCRRCGHASETLPHVLCHCMQRHSVAYQRRHDALLARLANAVRRDGVDVRVNRQVPGVQSTLRPDLVVTRDGGATVVLADVTVAFENGPEALQAASDAKVRKYAPLVAELRAAGKEASVVALVVGPLGTWWRGNEAVLRRLRVSRAYARLMRRLMVSDTLRWSRDVYIEHITGHRQYQ